MAEPAEIIGQKNSHFIGATDGVYVCVCVFVCTIGDPGLILLCLPIENCVI